MPVTWTISDEERLVVAVLSDSTTAQEILDLLGSIIERNAMPFSKIVDASAARHWIAHAELSPITATVRLYSQMKLGPIGPLAIVTGNSASVVRAEEFVRETQASRPVHLFSRFDEARSWIQSLQREGEQL
jgi:hypothetical protein